MIFFSLGAQQPLAIAMASRYLSIGQPSDYIEDVCRLIKALSEQGDVAPMARNLSKLTALVRNRLKSPSIASHHREVNCFSTFQVIMQYKLPGDPERMLATLEHMSWAFYGLVARAELQGDVDHMGRHSSQEIRAILELVTNRSMNGRADQEATAYWMRRRSLSHQEVVWLYEPSGQSTKPPPHADSHQEDKHPILEQRLCSKMVIGKPGHTLKPQQWTKAMRSFIYELDGEDGASVRQQFIRTFPEVGDVDMAELDEVRSQYDLLKHQVKLFG